MADQIQLRGGTAAEWLAVTPSPILAQKELAVETDTKKMKIGDGVTAWDALEYLNTSGKVVKTVVGNTTGFGLTINPGDVASFPAGLPTGIYAPTENTYFSVVSTGTAWVYNNGAWLDTNLHPDNITNPPCYTDGVDVRIVADESGAYSEWLPVVCLRNDTPSKVDIPTVTVSMERSAYGKSTVFNIDCTLKSVVNFAVICSNFTSRGSVRRNFGVEFYLVPRGSTTFVQDYYDAGDPNNWIPMSGTLANIAIGTNYSGDGWGNNAAFSANGFLERFSLTESEYQWLVGQYSAVTILKSATGDVILTMKNQHQLFILDGFDNNITLPNIGSGFTCRFLLAFGSVNSSPIFNAFQDDGISPTRFDVPDPALNISNTSPWTFNSGSDGPHDLLLTFTDNGGHYEVSSQDFLNWMKGKLAWDKIDFSTSSILSLNRDRRVSHGSGETLVNNDIGATHQCSSNISIDLTDISHLCPFGICNTGVSDIVITDTETIPNVLVTLPVNAYIECVITQGGSFEIIASNKNKLVNGGVADRYHSHNSGFESEPIVYAYATTAYAAGTTYKAGTVVIYNSTPYGAKATNVGNQPDVSPTFWRTLPDATVPAGDANHAYIVVETCNVWFADDSTRDNHTLHTIAESGWLMLTADVSNYLYADRNTDMWTVITTLYTDMLQFMMYMEMFCRSSSRSAHKQKVEINSHGEIEMSSRRKFTTSDRYKRELGALLGLACADTSLAITLGGGGVYTVNHRYEMDGVTTATRIFKCELISGVWSYSSTTAPTLYSNTQYNGTTGLATLTDSYYGILWLWRGIEDEDHLYAAFSQEQYASIDLAKAAKKLTIEPPLATSHAMAIGRLIFQKSQTTGIVCESAFDSVFAAASAVTDHGGMGGLGDDDHQQYYNQTRGDARYAQLVNANLSGLSYAYSTTVGGNPAVGTVRVGNGTLTTATLLHISETDGASQTVDSLLDLLTVAGCWIKLYDRTAPATNYHWYKTTGTFVSTGSPVYDPIPVAWQFGGGSFTDGMALDVTIDLIPADVAGGANKQIIFNDNGVENGDTDLTWDKTLNQLIVNAGSIGQTAIANPTPVASTLLQYVTDSIGKLFSRFMGPSGVDWAVQPHHYFNRVASVQCTGAAYAYQGCSTKTDTGGTNAHVIKAAGSIKNQMAKLTMTTGTTTNTICYGRHATGDMECFLGNAAGSGGFFFAAKFGINTLGTGNIMFIGLMPRTTPTATANTNTYLNAIGLTYQTNSGNWFITTNNGSGTATQTDLTATMALNTTDVIELLLFATPNSANVNYKVTNITTGASVSGTLTSKTPAVNTMITPHIFISNNASTASAVVWFSKWYLETDY